MYGISENIGGVETYILNLFKNLDHSKYEVYFPYKNKMAYYDKIVALGGKPIKITVTRHNPIKYYVYMNNLYKKHDFDVVYYNTCDIMSIDPLIFGKVNNVPTRIIHSHSSANIVKPNFFHKITEKWCRKNLHKYATNLLACSKIAGDWMFGENNYEIINNGIYTDEFVFSYTDRLEIRNKLKIDDKYVIGFIGRLVEEKNPFFLIDVFSNFKKTNENSALIIIGDGELKSLLIKYVEKLKLENFVFFLGTRSDISKLMSAMDCFLLPSKFEGLPFVLIEAQSNGLPCIVSTEVSTESNITGNMKFLSLNDSVNKWVAEISSAKIKNRGIYSQIIKDRGYDITTIAKQVEQFFENHT